MSKLIIGIAIGIIIGIVLGAFCMALAVSSKHADSRARELMETGEEDDTTDDQ